MKILNVLTSIIGITMSTFLISIWFVSVIFSETDGVFNSYKPIENKLQTYAVLTVIHEDSHESYDNEVRYGESNVSLGIYFLLLLQGFIWFGLNTRSLFVTFTYDENRELKIARQLVVSNLLVIVWNSIILVGLYLTVGFNFYRYNFFLT